MKWSYQEWLGLILVVGVVAALNVLAWQKILASEMVAGAEIGWVGMVIGFFYRKAKPGATEPQPSQTTAVKPEATPVALKMVIPPAEALKP